MGNRLKDNLSSDYIHAANKLNSLNARTKIVAYVESYDDIFFGGRCSVGLRTRNSILR